MSNRYRNPFKIRATERLESENTFLQMYSPYVLGELIEKNRLGKLWNNVLFIRSSPGAGKTSILKVFEPSSLLTLYNNRSAQYYRDIIEHLNELEVIDEHLGVQIVGVYLSCARNYEVIEDLDISEGQKKNIFFALLNARIVLSTLRSLIVLYGDIELSDITVNTSSFDYAYLDLNFPTTGDQLFSWAAGIEKSVFKAIDSFLPLSDSVPGHNELFAFSLMQANNLTVRKQSVKGRLLFMFDDAHKLSRVQRLAFLDHLVVKRSHHNIWIAERLDALDEQHIIGSYKARDYEEINLEESWQGTNKLKNIVANIAEKRAAISSEDVKSFRDFLEEGIKESEYNDKFTKAIDESLKKIESMAGYTAKFENWLKYLAEKRPTMTSLNYAILCRQVEILINRSIGRTQLSFEFALTVQELEQKLGGEIQSTALFLMSIENKVPYYYGFDNLVKLSSNNIEQFLSFAGDLYEIMLARKISDKPITVQAGEQERLLRKISDAKWLEQSRLVPQSENVLKFLHNLATFCQKETYKPNAPYAPGVNGFSINEPVSSNTLLNNQPWRNDSSYRPLMDVLRICLSYNLIEKRITKQGKENQQWIVYYLNRWVCLRYNLPFSYGGFRHRTPGELLKWVKS